MKRRLWLIWAVLILFGVEAPLCVMACIDSGESRIAASTPAVGDLAGRVDLAETAVRHESCHGDAGSRSSNSSDSSRSSGESSTSGDCGCDFTVAALLSETPTESQPVETAWTFVEIDRVAAVDRRHETPHLFIGATGPPRDILLLKSTLLI